MLIPKNHWSLKYEHAIINLCSNYFKDTPINFFNFARFYKDGWVINLTTNNNWHKHYWQKNYIISANDRLIQGFNYWLGAGPISKAAIDAEENFGIAGRIEIIEDHDEYIDAFGFAGAPCNKELMINFYLNNLTTLQNFNLLFLSEFKNIIQSIEKTHRLLPLPFLPKLVNIETKPINYYNNLKKLRFNDKGKDIVLTMFQVKVLTFNLRGYSIETTAKILSTGLYNVSKHLTNIKKKILLNEYDGFKQKCIELGIYALTENIYETCLNNFLAKK